MVDMMKDVVRRGSAASVWASGFHIPAAGKTGTTNDGTDVWFIGYTPDLVTGIWMGFDRPQKIQSNAQGGRLVAPAWTSFMSEIYQRRPAPPDWPRPDGLVVREVDKYTGLLRSPFCPDSQVVNEFYIEGTEPVQQCSRRVRRRGRLRASGAATCTRSGSRPRTIRTRCVRAPRRFRRRLRRRATRVRGTDRSVPPRQAVTSWTPIDCHAHTTMSDGELSIEELIATVRARGVRPSVADHLSTEVSVCGEDRWMAVREYLDALEPYDVARGGEFCWHDSLWRELPDDLVARFTHRIGSLHAVRIAGETRLDLDVGARRCPTELTPAAYMAHHIDELERFAAEMPVDILAHPTLLPLPIRELPVDELWTEELEERLVDALYDAGIAFEISNRYRAHERLVQARPRSRRAALARLRRPHARAGRRSRVSARDGEARRRGDARALRSVRARDARHSVIRYHARWVLPISSPPIRDGTVVELGGRIVYVGPRDDAPADPDGTRSRSRRLRAPSGPRQRAHASRAHRVSRIARGSVLPRMDRAAAGREGRR